MRRPEIRPISIANPKLKTSERQRSGPAAGSAPVVTPDPLRRSRKTPKSGPPMAPARSPEARYTLVNTVRFPSLLGPSANKNSKTGVGKRDFTSVKPKPQTTPNPKSLAYNEVLLTAGVQTRI